MVVVGSKLVASEGNTSGPTEQKGGDEKEDGELLFDDSDLQDVEFIYLNFTMKKLISMMRIFSMRNCLMKRWIWIGAAYLRKMNRVGLPRTICSSSLDSGTQLLCGFRGCLVFLWFQPCNFLGFGYLYESCIEFIFAFLEC
jgi:hypothetical protein